LEVNLVKALCILYAFNNWDMLK